jgi:ATP-dependent RNA helicase MSS116
VSSSEASAAVENEAVEDAPSGIITRFDDLAKQKIVHPNLVAAITQDMGLETMTDVQVGTINEAIKGVDLYVMARSSMHSIRY